MLIRIEGHDLPGRECAASGTFPGYQDIHVGVQRRDRPTEWLDLQPGDAPTVTWTLECTAATVSETGLDVRGPYIQGGPGQRFIYLSWGVLDRSGTFSTFRRAKLWLDAIDPAMARAALAAGALVGALGLTDRKGHPLCASVRPPLISWTA